MKKALIDTVFWSDNWVIELDPSEKLLYLYLMAHPNKNVAGLFEFSLKLATVHTGFEKDTILRMLERFERKKKIIVVGEYLLLVNYVKHQSLGDKVVKGIERILSDAPTAVLEAIGDQTLQKCYGAYGINYPTINQNSLFNETHTKSNSRADTTTGRPAKHRAEDIRQEEVKHPLRQYILDNCPNVSKLANQLTDKEAQSLVTKYSSSQIYEVLLAMENHKSLSKKYRSVYLTLNNWLKRRASNANNKADRYVSIRSEDFDLPETF